MAVLPIAMSSNTRNAPARARRIVPGVPCPAQQHLLATAPGGHESDDGFDKPDDHIRMRMHEIAPEQYLEATTERHPARRGHDWE